MMRLSSLLHRSTSQIARSSCAPRALASLQSRFVHVEAKLDELGLRLPQPKTAKGNYIQCKRVGNLIFTAGHLPEDHEGDLMQGKVGVEVTSDEACKGAELCALNVLGTLKHELGDLDKVKQVVKVVGFVNCVDSYFNQPSVLNGASDLFAKVFGEKGVHSRSAVGTNALPLNVPVEVECVFEVED